MTDRHLNLAELPDFDCSAIRHRMNARVVDIRHGRVPPIPGSGRAARPADTGLWTEAR